MPHRLPAGEREWLTVEEVATELQIGRNKAYELVRQGRIRSHKLGNAIRIHRDALRPDALDGGSDDAARPDVLPLRRMGL